MMRMAPEATGALFPLRTFGTAVEWNSASPTRRPWDVRPGPSCARLPPPTRAAEPRTARAHSAAAAQAADAVTVQTLKRGLQGAPAAPPAGHA